MKGASMMMDGAEEDETLYPSARERERERETRRIHATPCYETALDHSSALDQECIIYTARRTDFRHTQTVNSRAKRCGAAST